MKFLKFLISGIMNLLYAFLIYKDTSKEPKEASKPSSKEDKSIVEQHADLLKIEEVDY